MPFTEEQRQVVKNYILADPVLSTKASGPGTDYGALATALNQVASPEYTVWKNSVTSQEIMANGFDWVRVDNLSVGKARIWEWMFQFGTINPSKANVRLGIDECWKGTAADLAVRAAVYVHCKRLATQCEKLLATGSGLDASPSTLGWDGLVAVSDIGAILA